MKRRILVATDGSKAADRAVDYAAGLAKREGADLLIANVVGGYGLPQKAMIKLTQSEQVWLKDLLESLSAETLTKARESARAAGADQIQLESRAGDVAQSIIDIANEKAADVIVVGKRGAGLVERLLLGSVSHKLVNLATLPVIVVP
jgi:nucleotide-binding universal stress UspA family protein